ncbi:MAG: hypothetical protein K0S34_505 [Bacillales bacterium]|jgi:hypothetical protein|nr:hypothetical protein [Bacillales bacterium]
MAFSIRKRKIVTKGKKILKFEVHKNPILVVLSVLLIPLGILIVCDAHHLNGPLLPAYIAMILCIFIGVYMLYALVNSFVVITDDEFISVFGFYKKSIRLSTIKSVRYTWNPISSKSWTLKRLEIIFNDYNMLLLSRPKDSEMLFNLLEEKCNNAKVLRS